MSVAAGKGEELGRIADPYDEVRNVAALNRRKSPLAAAGRTPR
jgi:hypothetical protein